MNGKFTLMAGAALAVLAVTQAAAETLRYSFQADVNTLDPHSLNETFTLGYQGNIYEGLTRRGPDLAIEPALATRWEIVEPNRWRFSLREGVTFHNGNPFNADDVLFSADRARADGSDLASRLSNVAEVIKVDDYTVDFVTVEPDPILNAEWDTWFIMDREWAEENDAVAVTNVAEPDREFYANRNANGTGPFMIQSREPDVRTVAVVNPNWWDEPEHNLTEVVLTPIASAPTRVAALLSGELDVAFPVPLQDLERVEAADGVRALTGPELRTIFLGMDQGRDELLYSDITGRNPFKDRRVREAFYLAIDADAIQRVVMRGQSTPTAAMVAPGVNGFPAFLKRYPHDPERAKTLLVEAGYPDGFSVTMDCPNDRYVNDEAICQAVVGMLGRIGITVDLLAQTRSVYFGKVLAQGGYDTSFYLLGWTPGSFDSYNPLRDLVHTQGEGVGGFNLGNYSNPEIDALTSRILVETDLAQRDRLIAEAWQLLHDDVGYLPLHQQALAWGVREGVEVAQRADNKLMWRHVRVGSD
ncbi:MAG: ABC transporter substrate-binding protein [Inquilinaceae bacterium]